MKIRTRKRAKQRGAGKWKGKKVKGKYVEMRSR